MDAEIYDEKSAGSEDTKKKCFDSYLPKEFNKFMDLPKPVEPQMFDNN